MNQSYSPKQAKASTVNVSVIGTQVVNFANVNENLVTTTKYDILKSCLNVIKNLSLYFANVLKKLECLSLASLSSLA
jgi:hypothetical protein